MISFVKYTPHSPPGLAAFIIRAGKLKIREEIDVTFEKRHIRNNISEDRGACFMGYEYKLNESGKSPFCINDAGDCLAFGPKIISMSFHEQITFNQEDFTSKQLIDEEFDTCIFRNCLFTKADLAGSKFVECEFISCQFIETCLQHTGFRDAKFNDCKLIGLEFANCHDFLLTFSFTNCQLDYCNFQGLSLQQMTFLDCKMEGVNFANANLKGSVFQNCNLDQAIFVQSMLEKTDFRTASNYAFDPELNKMKGAKFSAEGLGGLLKKYKIQIY